MVKNTKLKERESGIELLKIISIFMIVIFHCIQSYSCGKTPFLVLGVDIFKSTEDTSMIILQLMYYLGNIGNIVFVICSSYFLVDGNKVKTNKIARIIGDLVFVSYVFFTICLIDGIKITELERWRSVYPLTYSGNWFITCYVLLYIFHPLLNAAIKKLDQKGMLAYCGVFFFCYCIWGSIKQGQYFQSSIINFIVIYFFTAYMKKYLHDFSQSKKNNIILLITGIIAIIVIQLITNHLDVIGTVKSKDLYHWDKISNPFLMMVSFSLFNLFRKLKFKNKAVNYIASLTVIIYILHENVLFKTYYRPRFLSILWFGTDCMNVALFPLLGALVIFFAALIISFIYDKTLRKLVYMASDTFMNLISIVFNKTSNKIVGKKNEDTAENSSD